MVFPDSALSYCYIPHLIGLVDKEWGSVSGESFEMTWLPEEVEEIHDFGLLPFDHA